MMTPPNFGEHAPIAILVRAYLDADYRWQHEGDWHDLLIGLPAPALELLYPDIDTFGLASAWNPHSVEQTEIANRSADHTLHDQLIANDKPYCAAFASAPNRSWREPSWILMGVDVAKFDELARTYRQLGWLWWTRGAPVRLRVDAPRPQDFEDDEFVDWLE